MNTAGGNAWLKSNLANDEIRSVSAVRTKDC